MIDRRQLIQAAAAASALPAWLADAFGIQDPTSPQDPQPVKEPERVLALRAAWRRASGWGKPLLVLVVPEDAGRCWERGQVFGALLNHGGPAVLRDLALAEVACATVAEVEQVLGKRDVTGEPLMLLAESSAGAPGAVAIDVKLEPGPAMEGPTKYEEWSKAVRGHAKAQNAAVAAAVTSALVYDRGVLATRADQCRATLAEDERAPLERFLAGGATPAPALLLRTAAVVRMAAEAPRGPGDRDRLLGALERAARTLLVEQRIPGSKWATTEGCGHTIEGDPQGGGMIACGMGAVPPLSRRFLYLFAE